ncbi:Transcription factor IIIB subunit [Zea mays]|uniref:Transcription factor IIIB subunit n=1 Tax=Zea mays TaxID=4577 RepID=A0A3L6E3B9_MAIZE|nr:Transcription factor IIIB subunit [Zea mays]
MLLLVPVAKFIFSASYIVVLTFDFSNFSCQANYVLGAVFLQLCQVLQLAEHPVVQKLVDPSLFIHRFTKLLLGRRNNDVSDTALCIVASMKRDWMQAGTGRKPSGLCGAALYIAALSHGCNYTKADIVSPDAHEISRTYSTNRYYVYSLLSTYDLLFYTLVMASERKVLLDSVPRPQYVSTLTSGALDQTPGCGSGDGKSKSRLVQDPHCSSLAGVSQESEAVWNLSGPAASRLFLNESASRAGMVAGMDGEAICAQPKVSDQSVTLPFVSDTLASGCFLGQVNSFAGVPRSVLQVSVVHVCEATLTKRLIEFENTDSGSLTVFLLRCEHAYIFMPLCYIEEFLATTDESNEEPVSKHSPKSGEIICKHKDKGFEHFAHGLCEKCYNKFTKLSGGLEGGSVPPAFQRAEKKRLEAAKRAEEAAAAKEAALEESLCDTQNSEVESAMTPRKGLSGDKSSKMGSEGLINDSMPPKDPEEGGENCEGNADPESLSDIDDAEVDGYLHNEEETQYKKIIWEEMNKEYLEEQADKEALAAELAARGIDPEAGKKKRKRNEDTKSSTPAETPAEATCNMLKRKGLGSKINVGAVDELYKGYRGERRLVL